MGHIRISRALLLFKTTYAIIVLNINTLDQKCKIILHYELF